MDIEKFLKFENADERTKIEMQKRDVDNKFENIKLQLQSSWSTQSEQLKYENFSEKEN